MSRTAVRPGSAVGIRNGRSAMGKQEANIYEIAREAGVSIATVSRVMNHSASVSEKSYQKVMAAVSKFNYVPNGTARSLSTSTSNAIGDLNGAIDAMPKKAVTIGMAEILGAKKIRLGVFRDWHRSVVRQAAYGEVSAHFPATLIQRHPDAMIIVNANAAKQPF